MSSSRASSPASDSPAGSPTQLTPRSKVKAMLAALDDESDGEIPPVFNKPDFLATADKPVDAKQNEDRPLRSIAANVEDVEDDDDDGDVIFKPRGRMAGRMNPRSNKSEEVNGNGADTARERVKKMLQAQIARKPEAAIENSRADSSDAEDGAVASRKRRVRRSRDRSPKSSPAGRHSSPEGMFVSPAKNLPTSPAIDHSDSDSDLPENPVANARFMALVAKKREERLAKEKEINRLKAEKANERKKLEQNHSDILEEDAMYGSDDENGGRRLTQQVRPTRKASKKALEDMHKETQRMSRSMQLAHEARTKKKITKSSLFAKFNFKPTNFVEDDAEPAPPMSSSSPGNTDTETRDTPPTSPTYHDDLPKSALTTKSFQHASTTEVKIVRRDSDSDGLALNEILSSRVSVSIPPTTSKVDKGKGKAIEEPSPQPETDATAARKGPIFTQKLIRVQPPKTLHKDASNVNDSDSDLEIVTTKTPVRNPKKQSIFDRVPAKKAQESHSLHALRMLAHLNSPGKDVRGRNTKPFMTATELTMSLQQQARQQATREREERLQALRDRGVILQTVEEREREMADVEDLIAKARREGEELMKKEKEALKREKLANGEVDPLGDSSDDEEWQEKKVDLEEEMSPSGSESDEDADGEASNEDELEDEDEEDAISMDEDANPASLLLDNEASESETEENDADKLSVKDDSDEEAQFVNDDDDELPAAVPRRRTKKVVLSDDEAESTPAKTSKLPPIDSPLAQSDSPVAPPSVLRSATKTFIPGLTVAGPAGLGLTQIFAGTMDDSQMQDFEGSLEPSLPAPQQLDCAEDSLKFFRKFPAPSLPDFEPTMEEDTQDIVRDSQTQMSQCSESQLVGFDSQSIQLRLTQSQIHGFDSLVQDPFPTQLSEFPEPTQDAGFQEMSPIKGRFAAPPPSTVDTVIVGETPVPDRIDESPVAKKKGKLRRRTQMPTFSDNEDEVTSAAAVEDDEFDVSASVFDVMRKAAKRQVTVDEFDKKKSGAKEMVQEQAEESEDEYHGLGGASDDESGGEEDAFVKAMIDDEAGKDADERQLAAFYADKERASDSKQVEKLFRDITNGTLRRKLGADYSLSDSDDDGEARRRMKRREFAKMRKALLEDEAIGKIAENPKKLAFLRAIEDRGDDDEMDFLDDFNDSQDGTDSQSQSQAETGAPEEVSQVDDSQPESVSISTMGPPKRKLASDAESANRLPPNQRRTKPAKRPSNLSEIRESLSSLIEAPNAVLAASESSNSDADSDLEVEHAPAGKRHRDKENRDPFAPRRSASVSVVDRISLKRASSSNLTTSARLAFAAPASTPGFKVPPLLRRATTNSSISSLSGSSVSGGSLSGTERSAGGVADDGRTVAKKAGRNSGVQFMARENERKLKLAEGEKRREEKRWKGAAGRRMVVGGLFGMGKFE